MVIPAYNSAEWVETSIRSVLMQDMDDLEVIVVDDGSKDSTADRVRRIADKRIHLISQTNRGQSAAINLGIAGSKGRYIKLLDADDALAPRHLRRQLEVLQDAPNCVASCQWGYFFQNHQTVVPRLEHVQKDFADPLDWILASLTQDEGMMGGWMWLMPRVVLMRAGGYNETLSLNNDFDFSIRLLLASAGIRYASGAVYCYRKGVAAALSQSRGHRAMTSALKTTQFGIQTLLQREDSLRVRKVCADRMQRWLYEFYPDFPDLAAIAEGVVKDLGGSDLPPQGGWILRGLAPILGWKNVKKLRRFAERAGWRKIQSFKQRLRLRKLSETAGNE